MAYRAMPQQNDFNNLIVLANNPYKKPKKLEGTKIEKLYISTLLCRSSRTVQQL
jgi:hypothetical protein